MIAPRKPVQTLKFVDDYCALYQDIFSEVRSFESFKHLNLGMISESKRKSLPEIARVVGLDNEQSLHHFLTDSPWDIKCLRDRRLSLTLSMLKGQKFILIIEPRIFLPQLRQNPKCLISILGGIFTLDGSLL